MSAGTSALPVRVRVLALLDGAGSGVMIAYMSVMVASSDGPVAAALVLAAGSAGRMFALGWTRRLFGSGRPAAGLIRPFRAGVLLMTAGALAAMFAAGRFPPALVAVAAAAGGTGNSLTTTLAATARAGHIASFYPLAMVGAAAGASAVSTVFAGVLPVWLLYVVVVSQLVEPLLIRPFIAAGPPAPAQGGLVPVVARAFVLSLLSYGPLYVYAVLVAGGVGASWVGPAMVAYGVGAIAAGPADRLLVARFPSYASGSWRTTVLLAAVGVSVWAVSFHPAGVLVGRATAGLLMFLAQGRLLRSVLSGSSGSVPKVAAASTGLALGGAAGGVLATSLAGSLGVVWMAVVLAASTLALAPAGPSAGSARTAGPSSGGISGVSS